MGVSEILRTPLSEGKKSLLKIVPRFLEEVRDVWGRLLIGRGNKGNIGTQFPTMTKISEEKVQLTVQNPETCQS